MASSPGSVNGTFVNGRRLEGPHLLADDDLIGLGSAEGLLDADTNLKYAVKYLRGAYLVGGRNADKAMRHYSRGYYYDAKRMGLLDEVGY